jgi:hypothetical protein
MLGPKFECAPLLRRIESPVVDACYTRLVTRDVIEDRFNDVWENP